ncbi:Rv3235 family protein [Enemella sp. A6]|uniref:Rv3235 family protein n=1 Tax=Enemella sp. A6 TaxID=3440152 RepID=UPI003EBA96DC
MSTGWRVAEDGSGAEVRHGRYMTLVTRPAPEYRPDPLPVPRLPAPAPHHQPMLELLPDSTSRPSDPPRPARADPAWQLARGVSHAVVEVLAGRRPATQLERWATQPVVATLHVIARRRRRRPVRVATVRVQQPSPGVIEVGVRVEHDRDRSGAIALQLVRRDQRWLCCAVEMGPELSLIVRGTS